MALTPEQQAQIQQEVDSQIFRINAEMAVNLYEKERQRDAARRANDVSMEERRARLEAVRLAKETLTENSRSKPVDARDITAADITEFAKSLIEYVNQ